LAGAATSDGLNAIWAATIVTVWALAPELEDAAGELDGAALADAPADAPADGAPLAAANSLFQQSGYGVAPGAGA